MSDPDNVLSVSQLTRKIRSVLEGEIGDVWVEGEVSNHRLQTSGHQYFTLKDEGSQVSCVLFRHSGRSTARIADGAQVQVYGRLSVYEPRGQYQLIAKVVQPKGLGALQARFEALKRKLADEGLFDEEYKQPLPSFPTTVAIVTSPQGAAIRDMIHVLGRRAPWIRVLVYPVRVQGSGAEHEIAAAVQNINELSQRGLPRVDAIVVGRGGGSLEDLWNFNEEVVARAIFASEIPVISAVGHEIDFTIADFVADVRAPTPSAAAEILAPDSGELLRFFQDRRQRLESRLKGFIERQSQVLELMAKGTLLHSPQRQLQETEQALDEMEHRLREVARESLQERLDQLVEKLRLLGQYHPVKVIAEGGHRVELTAHRLKQAMVLLLEKQKEKIATRRRMLELLGPGAVLARGFSYTTDAKGKVLNRVSDVAAGAIIRTRLADGELTSVVE